MTILKQKEEAIKSSEEKEKALNKKLGTIGNIIVRQFRRKQVLSRAWNGALSPLISVTESNC